MTEREQFIAIVDNDILRPSDAIILLEGDGYYRVDEAITLYKSRVAPKIIFSGDIEDYKYGSYPLKDLLPKLLDGGVKQEDIIHENISLNTREQAIEVIKLSKLNYWKRLVLVASQEHQYRAYLTFLREVIDSNSGIILFNSPTRNLGWFSACEWGRRFERLKLEFLRIEKYSEFGHLASFSEAIQYQEWKESQF